MRCKSGRSTVREEDSAMKKTSEKLEVNPPKGRLVKSEKIVETVRTGETVYLPGKEETEKGKS